jgi:hypothetical protein
MARRNKIISIHQIGRRQMRTIFPMGRYIRRPAGHCTPYWRAYRRHRAWLDRQGKKGPWSKYRMGHGRPKLKPVS